MTFRPSKHGFFGAATEYLEMSKGKEKDVCQSCETGS